MKDEWKRFFLLTAKTVLNISTLDDLLKFDIDNLNDATFRKIRFLTSNLIRTVPGGQILTQSVLTLNDDILSIREKLLISLKTAWLCHSEYTFVSETLRGLQHGITWEDIKKIIGVYSSRFSDSRENILLNAVDELYDDFFLSDTTWEALSEAYNERQLTGIIYATGFSYAISMFCKSIGIQFEEKNEGFGDLSYKINQLESFKRIYKSARKIKRFYREKISERGNQKMVNLPRIALKDYSDWTEDRKNIYNLTMNTAFNVSSLSDLIDKDLSGLDINSIFQLLKLTSNIERTACYLPALMQHALPPPYDLTAKSLLPSRDKELLIIRTGWLCRAEYEFVAHVGIGLDIGITWEEIESIIEGSNSSSWKPEDTKLLKAVDELHENLFINDDTWKGLSRKYSNQQLMGIICVVARYHFVAMLNNSFGIQFGEKNEGFGDLSEKINNTEFAKHYFKKIIKARKLYRSKVEEYKKETFI